MDLPVFALHSVTFPGMPLGLRVFEPRYLAMMDDVVPDGRFVAVAIRQGAEVGGGYEPYRVGTVVAIRDHVRADDGTWGIAAAGIERMALVAPVAHEPYAVWTCEPYPDEGGAGTDDVEAARRAFARFLEAAGETTPEALPVVPHEPVAASWALAAGVPGLVPDRQALLEIPGAGERLRATRDRFVREAGLLRILGAGAAGAGPGISPN
jgi:Lon protease-like protein